MPKISNRNGLDLAVNKQKNTELEGILVDRDRSLLMLRNELFGNEIRVTELETTLSDREKEVQTLEETLAERDRSLVMLRRELFGSKNRVAELEGLSVDIQKEQRRYQTQWSLRHDHCF